MRAVETLAFIFAVRDLRKSVSTPITEVVNVKSFVCGGWGTSQFLDTLGEARQKSFGAALDSSPRREPWVNEQNQIKSRMGREKTFVG